MRDKPRKVSLFGLLKAAAALTVLFSVLTGFDIPHHSVQLFSHFRLQYLVASILLIVVFIFLRNYVFVGALTIVAAFNTSLVLPWYIADVDDVSGAPIKIIHANVHSSNTEYDRLINFVRTENPDIFFLQEVSAAWVTGTSVLQSEYPYSYTEPRSGNFGIAVFSKIPFDSIAHVDSPPFDYPTIVATATFNTERITLISSHPTIPLGRVLFAARNEQLISITELVEQASGEVVLIGDFNASIWDAHLRQLEQQTGLNNVRRGFGVVATWPTFFPIAMIPIDHALVSAGISVLDVRAGEGIGSDHLPLIVTISL